MTRRKNQFNSRNNKRPQQFNGRNGNNKKPRSDPEPPEGNNFNVSAESKFPLEALPSKILDLIFEYVQTPDLLKLCYISHSLYSLARSRIYDTICVCSADNVEWAKQNMHFWKVSMGTVIGKSGLERLSALISRNQELRPLVRKINFVDSLCLDSTLLSDLGNLQAFYSFHGHKVTPRRARNLQSVRSVLYSIPKFTTSVVELEIVHTPEEWIRGLYNKLAVRMIELNSFENLSKLNFTFEGNRGGFPNHSTGRARHEAHWLDFFDEVIVAGVKLRLSELGLLGREMGDVAEGTGMLRQAIDFSVLKKLRLDHVEPKETPANKSTILQALTKHTPLLKSLAVFGESYAQDRHVRSLYETLVNNIPHQLEDLFVLYFPTHDIVHREVVQSAILISQRKLMKLKIDTGFEDHAEIFDRDGPIGEAICTDWSNEARKQLFFPRVLGNLHFRPHMGQTYRDATRERKIQIQRFFETDLIYKSATHFLPHLSQYYCELVFVDPQRRAVYLNDEMMPLDACLELDDPERRKKINARRDLHPKISRWSLEQAFSLKEWFGSF